MTRRVKGVLFLDYVRMLRALHQHSWSSLLEPEDLPYLEQTIDPAGWYPMRTFERFGIAILHTVAADDMELVRKWGRASAGHVAATVDHLLVPGDPRESLMRFHVYRRAFFDFEALTMLDVIDGSAALRIDYGMSPLAEEAASIQTQGFFEGLLDSAGATGMTAVLTERTWAGDARTVLQLVWQPPGAEIRA
jgi:hypothetical protein